MYVKCIVGNDDAQHNCLVMKTNCNDGWSCPFACNSCVSWSGSIHSKPWVCDQHWAAATLWWGNEPLVPLDRMLGGLQSWAGCFATDLRAWEMNVCSFCYSCNIKWKQQWNLGASYWWAYSIWRNENSIILWSGNQKEQYSFGDLGRDLEVKLKCILK